MNKTDIVLFSPHNEGCYKKGIISTIYQKDGENIASTDQVQVHQQLIQKQHVELIKTLEDVNMGKVIACDFPDEKNSEKIKKLIELFENKQYSHCLDVLGISNEEFQQDMIGSKKDNKENFGKASYIKKPENIEEYLGTFLEKLESGDMKFGVDSTVFMRDTFISNQNDKILISNFRKRDRRFQSQLTIELFENFMSSMISDKEVIINTNSGEYFEGGDFRYIPSKNILFAGYTEGSSRNSKEGINFVRSQFGIEDKNYLELASKKAFHLDTFFSALTDNNGDLIGGIICDDICAKESLEKAKDFFNKKNLPLMPVSWEYGIAKTKYCKKEDKYVKVADGNGTINTLQLNEYLISSDVFPHEVEMQLEKIGVKRKVTPTSEFWKAGGGVHCLTNQL